MAIEDYEELQLDKFINVTNLSWRPPLLEANFGGGYGAGAVVAPYGLHKWVLTAAVIPDLDAFSIDYEVDGDPFTDTRFEYFFSFLKRHALLGNKPFVIRDPRTETKFLVAAEIAEGVEFEQMTAALFSGGITLRERRADDLTFNTDGSIDLDYTAPSVSLSVDGSAPRSGTRTITATAADAVSIEFYVDHELLSTDSSSPFTASWNTFNFRNGTRRVRAKATDAAGNVTWAVLDVEIWNDHEAPTRIADLAAAPLGKTSIEISFTPPTDNVAVTDYEVDLFLFSGAYVATEPLVPGDFTSSGGKLYWTQTGLTANTAYSLRVRSADAVGNWSEWSEFAVATTSA